MPTRFAMGKFVRLVHAALDQTQDGKGDIILRGSLDPKTLGPDLLLTAPYQREVLPLTTLSALVKALKEGANIPDIELGMRGGDVEDDGNHVFLLKNPVYIIDGLQRVTASRQVLIQDPRFNLRLGAKVSFNTTEASERQMFRVLNVDRTKLSSNVSLRNLRGDLSVVDLMYRLSEDKKGFALGGRVCWNQRMSRDHFVNAMSFARVVGRVHSHLGAGRYSQYDDLARGLNDIAAKIGPNVFRDNIRTFFDVIDECFGIRQVVFKEGAIYLRFTFMWCLAGLLSDHTDFWKGERLFVEKDLRRKIAGFQVADPNIRNLASAGGKARDILYQLMLGHANSGKRTRRLTPRSEALRPPPSEVAPSIPPSSEEEGEGDEMPSEETQATG